MRTCQHLRLVRAIPYYSPDRPSDGNTHASGPVATDMVRQRSRSEMTLSDSAAVRTDPAVFGRYWNADALYSKNSDGNQERVTIGRPLFASATHFTSSAIVDHLSQTARIYENAAIASAFQQQHHQLAYTGGVALRSGSSENFRLIAGIDQVTDTFTPLRGLAPG